MNNLFKDKILKTIYKYSNIYKIKILIMNMTKKTIFKIIKKGIQ